jgi:hypothetical protein
VRHALLAALLLCAGGAAAEQVRRADGHEIRYNAFRADFLPAAVARRHGLTRAADRGLLNVTVLRARADATLEPIAVDVRAHVAREGRVRDELRMRAVREAGAVSYIGAFRLEGDRPYAFELEVTLPGATRAERIRFRQAVAAQ